MLQVAQALPARIECPRCRTRFVVNDPKRDKASLIKKDRDAVRGTAAGNGVRAPGDSPIRAFGTVPTPLVVPSAVVSVARGRKSGGGLGILIALLLILLVGGGIAVIAILNRSAKTTPAPDQTAETEIEPPAPILLTERQRKINEAVSKGVNYLRNEILNPNAKNYYFTDPGAGSNVGVLALAGLTLLECGVPSTEPAVEKVIKNVREEAPRLTFTYSVALCILFLDRLNQCTDRPPDPANREMIQRLAVQMMAAQNANGGWGYACPLLTQERYDSLVGNLKAGRFRPASYEGTYDDNSINQFATLALWTARKHGIKTEPALAMMEKRYLANQNVDGSWGYRARDDGDLKDATTCAGLIGLAVGQGIREGSQGKSPTRPAQDPTKIPSIAHGLAYIGKTIGKDPRRMNPKDREKRLKHTADMMELNRQWQEAQENDRKPIMNRIQELDKAKLYKGTYFNSDSWGDLYFLWSVERVAVIFDLNTIAGKEWYDWGTDVILPNQKPDGSWRDRFPGIPDTCFALLFLKRANIAKDLTDKFRLVAGGPAIGAAPVPVGPVPPQLPRRKE